MFNAATSEPSRTKEGLDFPVIAMTSSIALTMALVVIGVMGSVGILSGSTFGWIVLGGSTAITLLSMGTLAPASLITLVLAILGLTGVLPFTSVGIGVAITLTIALIGGCMFVSHHNT